MYWLKNKLTNATYIDKKEKDTIDLENYSTRVNFKDEIPISDPNKINLNNNRITDNNELKIFRFRNRLSFSYEDFTIDLTTTKSSKGKTFKKSNCLKMPSVFMKLKLRLIKN